MTSLHAADVEAALAVDPLARRLATLSLPVPARLHDNVCLGSAARPRARLRFRTAVALCAAVASVCVVALTPAGAAVARAILPDGMQQRLGLVEGAPAVLVPPATRSTPSGTPMPCSQVPRHGSGGGGILCYPDLSLAAVQSAIAFTMPTPSSLPAGVAYRGGLVDTPYSARLFYGRAGHQPGSVGLTVSDRAPVGGPAVPSGTVQRVQVDGATGYVVRGDYESSGPGAPAHWNPAADDLELTWSRDGFTFDLTAAGLHLSVPDLVRIAESVH